MKIVLFIFSVFFLGLFISAVFGKIDYIDSSPHLLLASIVCFLWGLKPNAFQSVLSFYENAGYSKYSWLIIRVFFLITFIQNYRRLDSYPLSQPLSFLQFMPFLDYLVLAEVQANIFYFFVMLLLLFLFEIKSKIVVPLISIIFLVQCAASMSFGRIGHASYLPAQLLLMLSFSMVLIKEKIHHKGHLFFVMHATLSLYYFLSFSAKIFSDPFTPWFNDHTLRVLVMSKVYDRLGYTGVLEMNVFQSLVVNHPTLTLLSSFGAFVLEGAGGLLIFLRSHLLKAIILLGLCSMHLGIWVMMDIQFMENVQLTLAFSLVELLIFVPELQNLIARIRKGRRVLHS